MKLVALWDLFTGSDISDLIGYVTNKKIFQRLYNGNLLLFIV